MAKKKIGRKAALPRITSKTVTVRSLLLKIKRLILDEPLRLDMRDWVTALGGVAKHPDAPPPMPACGTVACMAGWGAILLRPDSAKRDQLNAYAEVVLTELVGHGGRFSYHSVGDLFTCDRSYEFGELDEDGSYRLPDPGTVEHAQVVAARIDTYIANYPEVMNRKIDVAKARELLAG